MYIKYKNFKIKKEKDFVKISCDGIIELEYREDEWLISNKFPKCLQAIVEKAIPFDKYDVYYIYALNIFNHSKITDYKKIWGLAGFEKKGLYDNHYDSDNGRIYLGISKGLIKCTSTHMVDYVSIYLPKEKSLAAEDIFKLFSTNRFDISSDKKRHSIILSKLQNLILNSIIIYQANEDTSLNIYADKVEQILDEKILPQSEVIER